MSIRAARVPSRSVLSSSRLVWARPAAKMMGACLLQLQNSSPHARPMKLLSVITHHAPRCVMIVSSMQPHASASYRQVHAFQSSATDIARRLKEGISKSDQKTIHDLSSALAAVDLLLRPTAKKPADWVLVLASATRPLLEAEQAISHRIVHDGAASCEQISEMLQLRVLCRQLRALAGRELLRVRHICTSPPTPEFRSPALPQSTPRGALAPFSHIVPSRAHARQHEPALRITGPLQCRRARALRLTPSRLLGDAILLWPCGLLTEGARGI
jgi:hypothetical protein